MGTNSLLLARPSMVDAENAPDIETTGDRGRSLGGTLSEPVLSENLIELQIFETKEYRQGGRAVFMHELEAPIFPRPVETPRDIREVIPSTEEQLAEIRKKQENRSFFIVSATVYNHEATLVRWWVPKDGRQQLFEAWSNVNWNHLAGMSSFERQGREFTYLLLHSNQPLKAEKRHRRGALRIVPNRIPKNLPGLDETGPNYIVVSGDEDNEKAMKFIEGIHDLYANNRNFLEKNYLKRERARMQRLEELRINPPKTRDLKLYFWDNDHNL